jgi:WD40 repeat protein
MKIYSGGTSNLWAVASLRPSHNQIAAFGADTLFLWDESNPESCQTFPGPLSAREHTALTLSADGRHFVVQGSAVLRGWEFSGAGWRFSFDLNIPGLCYSRFTGAPADLAVASFGVAEGGGAECRVVRYAPVAGSKPPQSALISRFPVDLSDPSARSFHTLHYRAADLSADGQWLLCSPLEKVVHVWHFPTGRLVGSVPLRGIPNEVVFSPDGSLFAVDAGTTVYVHRTRSLELAGSWKAKYSYRPKLSWSPDNRWLVRSDLSAAVRVFEVPTGREVQALAMRGQRACSVAFAPDGLTYLVGTVKGSVIIWDLEV